MTNRRAFLRTAGMIGMTWPFRPPIRRDGAYAKPAISGLYAHLWVYASRFPPNWDCTPILDEVFDDLSANGYEGIELMDAVLRHEGSVDRLKSLIQKYSIPVVASSYNADMWKKTEKEKIVDDAASVIDKLHAVGGKMLGITVGDAHRKKTEAELDAQAEVLQQLMIICQKFNIVPNLHNHTFEVTDNLYDLKGTMLRVPGMALGPDLNWLIRAGVDPIAFLKTYRDKIVYMHLRDQDAKGVWTPSLGEGVTDFPRIARTLREINYQGKAAVELAFDNTPGKPVRTCWQESREYVKKVFGWQIHSTRS